MKTRKEYLDGAVSHREYYAQFVTEGVKQLVEKRIGIDRLKKSTDEHLNDIPLKTWDNLFSTGVPKYIGDKLREAGDFPTMAGAVCILKEAARQILDSQEAKPVNIYAELLAAGVLIACHESDLYAKVTPESRAIIARYEYKGNVTTFKAQDDGALWYDIPFAYQPFWDKKARTTGKETR